MITDTVVYFDSTNVMSPVCMLKTTMTSCLSPFYIKETLYVSGPGAEGQEVEDIDRQANILGFDLFLRFVGNSKWSALK